MYTEIYVNVDLKEDTPDNVIGVLREMCGEGLESGNFPDRWSRLFKNGSYYTPNTECARLTYDDISRQWSLLGKGDIKNYEGEIEMFFDWIRPYVDGMPGDFIGYYRYEETTSPTLVYL